jgi:hypothetical protein
LALLGPLVKGAWAVPEALARGLLAAGRTVPAPVVGHMLVDTGASRTAIATHAAEALGLHPIGVLKLRGAHGEQDSPVFYAHFSLAIADADGTRLAIDMEQRVCGVEDDVRWPAGARNRRGGHEGDRGDPAAPIDCRCASGEFKWAAVGAGSSDCGCSVREVTRVAARESGRPGGRRPIGRDLGRGPHTRSDGSASDASWKARCAHPESPCSRRRRRKSARPAAFSPSARSKPTGP